MPTLGFAHFNLRAARPVLEELRAFYCDVVGLRQGERPPLRSFGYWLYAGQSDVLHLSEAGPEEDRSQLGGTAFDHVAFRCSGRAEFEQRLVQRGIRYELAQVPQTGQQQLFFSDPTGNGVELNFAPGDV
jgi:catechol 2,3-dioxygenase-like lactoylglutathione lyase family enzyme